MIDRGRIGFATDPTSVTIDGWRVKLVGRYTVVALVAGDEIATGSASVVALRSPSGSS